MAGFEPATSCSQSRRDNRATLHPEVYNIAGSNPAFHNFKELICGLPDTSGRDNRPVPPFGGGRSSSRQKAGLHPEVYNIAGSNPAFHHFKELFCGLPDTSGRDNRPVPPLWRRRSASRFSDMAKPIRIKSNISKDIAERQGFEPWRRLRVDRLAICSVTTPAPLH